MRSWAQRHTRQLPVNAIHDFRGEVFVILGAMAFTVWLGDDSADCGDGDMYEFLTGGVLGVHYATPGCWSDYYPPTVWTRIAAEPNHRPGEPLDRSIGPDFD
jgi:hypothetical protein